MAIGRRESADGIIQMLSVELAKNTRVYFESTDIAYRRTKNYYRNVIDPKCKGIKDPNITDSIVLEYRKLVARNFKEDEILNYFKYYKTYCNLEVGVEENIIKSLFQNPDCIATKKQRYIYNLVKDGLYFDNLLRLYYKIMMKLAELKKSQTFCIFPSFGNFNVPYIPFCSTAIADLLAKFKLAKERRMQVIYIQIT